MRILSIFLLLCLIGCGESESEKRARLKAELDRQVAESTSIVNVVADRLKREVGEDGMFKKWNDKDDGYYVDAWGQKLQIRYDKGIGRETLIVSSNGPDRLPFTKDDIGVTYTLKQTEYLQGLREKHIEGDTSSLTKGLTKGVFQGIREGIWGK